MRLKTKIFLLAILMLIVGVLLFRYNLSTNITILVIVFYNAIFFTIFYWKTPQ